MFFVSYESLCLPSFFFLIYLLLFRLNTVFVCGVIFSVIVQHRQQLYMAVWVFMRLHGWERAYKTRAHPTWLLYLIKRPPSLQDKGKKNSFEMRQQCEFPTSREQSNTFMHTYTRSGVTNELTSWQIMFYIHLCRSFSTLSVFGFALIFAYTINRYEMYSKCTDRIGIWCVTVDI